MSWTIGEKGTRPGFGWRGGMASKRDSVVRGRPAVIGGRSGAGGGGAGFGRSDLGGGDGGVGGIRDPASEVGGDLGVESRGGEEEGCEEGCSGGGHGFSGVAIAGAASLAGVGQGDATRARQV